jgi:hypothetical protein
MFFAEIREDTSASVLYDNIDYIFACVNNFAIPLSNVHIYDNRLIGDFVLPDTAIGYIKGGLTTIDSTTHLYSGMTTTNWISISSFRTVSSSVDGLSLYEDYTYQNYPNPFSHSTTIRYTLKNDAEVIVNVYSALGELVITKTLTEQSGVHEFVLNMRGYSSGYYFYRLSINGEMSTVQKLILIK